jgi:hypothetical protein
MTLGFVADIFGCVVDVLVGFGKTGGGDALVGGVGGHGGREVDVELDVKVGVISDQEMTVWKPVEEDGSAVKVQTLAYITTAVAHVRCPF